MKYIIYKNKKIPTQSGKLHKEFWFLENINTKDVKTDLLTGWKNTEVNFIKKIFKKRKRLKSDYMETMKLMKKYKINEDVKNFCNKYNKKSLKILKQFKGYQKDLFINLLINSINRTH